MASPPASRCTVTLIANLDIQSFGVCIGHPPSRAQRRSQEPPPDGLQTIQVLYQPPFPNPTALVRLAPHLGKALALLRSLSAGIYNPPAESLPRFLNPDPPPSIGLPPHPLVLEKRANLSKNR